MHNDMQSQTEFKVEVNEQNEYCVNRVDPHQVGTVIVPQRGTTNNVDQPTRNQSQNNHPKNFCQCTEQGKNLKPVKGTSRSLKWNR